MIIPSSGTFPAAAAFGWASHATWKECGNADCGNRLYAPREAVPRLAAINGIKAQVTIVAWVKLSTGQNVMHGELPPPHVAPTHPPARRAGRPTTLPYSTIILSALGCTHAHAH